MRTRSVDHQGGMQFIAGLRQTLEKVVDVTAQKPAKYGPGGRPAACAEIAPAQRTAVSDDAITPAISVCFQVDF